MNTIISKQVLPTYIKAFLRQDMECVLVYKKKSSEKFQEEWSFSSELKQFPNINDVTADSALDLTGNPLHVDLDESLKFTAANISLADCSPNWTIAEAQHFPLLLNEARNVLNTKFNSTSLSEPVFCITDGSDAQNTILIGKHHSKDFIITYLGQIMDLQPLKNDELWLEQLRKEHDMFIVIKPDSVQYNFHRIYNIYGSIVQDTPALEYSKCNGCVLLETSWNTYTNQEPNISETTMKIILKVISGHKDSIIHSLWNQLGDLQKYLGIIANQEAANDGNTVMTNNSIPDINNEIYKLCYNRINKKWALKSKGLEFTRLREENIIDKLWSLLNRCQNLKDLRHSLSNFLRLSKIENFDENDVLLADLVQYCSVNKEYISNLTYSESLKILVNFGFEKLKQDYLTIINFYDPIFQDALVKNWSEFEWSTQDQQSSGQMRGIPWICKVSDSTYNEQKMEFLKKLHNAAEVLAFLNHNFKANIKFSSENLKLMCNSILKRCVFNKSENLVESELRVKLIDIVCELSPRNNEIYKDKLPVTSIFEFISKIHTSKIRTIFHVSENPIFPKSIYDYEISEKTSRYISKLLVVTN